MRTYILRAVVCALFLLQLCDDSASASTEAVEARAHGRFVESMRVLADGYTYATALAGARGQLGIACPVPSATYVSSFGAPRDGHTHQGVDLMADFGTTILAPATGRFEGDGESFWLYGDDGTDYFGTHNGGDLAPNGRVTRGQPISTVSNTGNAAGGSPHEHFEIHPDGGPAVDPFPIVAAACDDARTAPAVRPVPAEASPRSLGGHRPPANEVRFFCGQRKGARWVACIHRLEGHDQWQHGRGTRGHTWARFKVQARAFRRYLTAVAQPDCRSGNPGECERLVRQTAARYGVDPGAAVSVARCESNLDPSARNPSGASGIFQHLASLWPSRAASYGFPGASVFSPVPNVTVAMMMVRDGGWGPWSCKP